MTQAVADTPTRGLVPLLATAGITSALTMTLVIPLLGSLPVLFSTTPEDASWVVTVTLLVAAVVMPVSGRLADMFGARRMLLASLIPLITGSLICALADSLVPMVIGRGTQGLALGMVPLGISFLHRTLPPAQAGAGIAAMSASLGVGGALGLPIAAGVAEFANWRTLFWGLAVVAAILLVLFWRWLPREAAPPPGGRFDYLGALGLATGLVMLLLGISRGGAWGWGSPLTLGVLAGAVAVLAGWGWWQLRAPEPLVDLRATVSPPVLVTNIATVLIGFASYAQSLIVPQLLQLPTSTGYGQGQSMLAMGLWMAPSGITMMAISRLGARLSRTRGPKTTLAVGAATMMLGYGTAAVFMGTLGGLVAATIIIGAGTGFAFGAMPALIMGHSPARLRAAANGFNSLLRSIGTSVAAAITGTVLAQLTTTLGAHTTPSETGFRVALIIGATVALTAAIIALTIPTRTVPHLEEKAMS